MKKSYLWILFSFIFLLGTGTFLLLRSTIEDKAPIAENPPKPQEVVESPPPIDPDKILLEQMSLEEKIGQLLVIGYKEEQPTKKVQEMIQQNKIGGFILFKRNYKSLEELIKLNNQLNDWNKGNPLPLFLSLDEEGGTVSRVPKEATHFPDARLLGKINDPNLTFQMGSAMGKELKASGINLNYAPVLDIVNSSKNKLLIKRAFGSTPEAVASHGIHFIEGLQSQGVIAAPKHFPGHGDTSVDSHGKLPKIMIDKETLLSRELVPFKAAVAAGIDAIMVGHLSFPLIDASEKPATKSSILLKDLLRKDLGYNGLIITDEIEMLGYINNIKNLQEAILQSIEAGVDVFVVGHTHEIQEKVLDIIKAAVQNGSISQDRLDESVMRIIQAKNKYDLAQNTFIHLEEAKKIVGSQEHKNLLIEIKQRASKP